MSTVNGGPGNVVNGLILYLDAANPRSYPGSGTTWSDISRGGNNGTLVNGPTYSSANGGSIVFNGSSTYVNVATLNAPTSFSIECFFNSQDNNYKTLLNFSPLYNPRLSLRNNVVNLYYQTPQGSGDILFTFTSILTNVYYHLMLTYDSTNNHTCYLNGVQGSRSFVNTAQSAIPAFTNLQIGNGAGSDGNFLGNISCVRIYNRVLTYQEIIQNYNTTRPRFGI